MKRFLLTFVSVLLVVISCLAGINRTLNEAQSLFNKATTIAEYQNAKKKFESARYDVGYVSSEHDNAINEGVRKCNRRIDELSPRLLVDGMTSNVKLNFSSSGGSRTLTISTNQGTPRAELLPSWISVSSVSSSSIVLNCQPNTSSSTRTDWFNVCAGSRTVRVDVTQYGGSSSSASNTNAQGLEITGAEFANTNYEGETLTNYGGTLYSSDMRYLKPRISYRGLSSSLTKTVYVKIIKPDGSVMTSSSSPSGYTYSDEETFYSGSNTKSLSGWGNNTASTYEAGTYGFEVWIDRRCAYRTSFRILSRSVSYLRVNNQTAVTTSVGNSGGTFTYTVSTDGSDWTLWGIPTFCEVTSRTSTSFTLRCSANSSSAPRSDYMKVICGNREVRIDINQAGHGANVVITSVDMEHNVYENGQKGMRIVVKFEADNMRGKRINCYAWFYQQDNLTALRDANGNHIYDGTSNIVQYDSAVFTANLFVPYSSFNVPAGYNQDNSFDISITDGDGNSLARNENYTFNLSRGY